MIRDLDLDDDDVLPYTRPLDLALILDGHEPDDPPEDEDGTEDEAEELDPLGHPKQAWTVILAERDDAGDWHTVGVPVPDAVFEDMPTAHLWAGNRNKRHFGLKFDWLTNPPRAWLAVRAGQLGVLRVNEPVPVENGGASAVALRDANKFCWASPISLGTAFNK